jgi:hypothetical protein
MWQLIDLQNSNLALLAICRTRRECTCVVCVYTLYLAFSVKGSSRCLHAMGLFGNYVVRPIGNNHWWFPVGGSTYSFLNVLFQTSL